jgi:hypothetical protein
MNPRDYREMNQGIADDIDTMIEEDPESFDILLYKAVLGSEETVTDVEDVVGSVESKDRSIDYEDPVEKRGKFLPFEFSDILAVNDGTESNMGSIGDTPMVMLINDREIPEQSVVQYKEFTGGIDTDGDDEIRTVTLYILKSTSAGQAGPTMAIKHYVIPMDEPEALVNE